MPSLQTVETVTIRPPMSHDTKRARSRALASVVELASWEEERKIPTATKEELDALARTAAAAFAVDTDDKIVYWNAGAEKLLGRAASDTLGKPCHEVLGGSDPFGNRYCSARCPMMSLTAAGCTPEPSCMEVKRHGADGAKVRMRTIALPEPGPRFTTLVHLLDPDEDHRLEKLVSDLRATAKGEPVSKAPAASGAANPLTPREREVVLFLSNGFAALNIAARLNLSHATVRNHIQNILRKLEVHGQVEAVSLAFRNGWI
jgi:DNA-binding CsgD family transcriptional regulator